MSTTMVLSTYLYLHFLWSIKKEQENVNQLDGSPGAIYGAHKKVVSRDKGQSIPCRQQIVHERRYVWDTRELFSGLILHNSPECDSAQQIHRSNSSI